MTTSKTLVSLALSLAVLSVIPSWSTTCFAQSAPQAAASQPAPATDADTGTVDNEMLVQKAKHDSDKADHSAAAINYDGLNAALKDLRDSADPKTRHWAEAAESASKAAGEYERISKQAKSASQRFFEAAKSVGTAFRSSSGKPAGDAVQQVLSDSNLQASIDDAANDLDAAQKSGDRAAAAAAEQILSIQLAARDTAIENIKVIFGQADLGGALADGGLDTALASKGAQLAILSAESAANAYVYRQMGNGLRLLDISDHIPTSFGPNGTNPGQVAAADVFKTIRAQFAPHDGAMAIDPVSHDVVLKFMRDRKPHQEASSAAAR